MLPKNDDLRQPRPRNEQRRRPWRENGEKSDDNGNGRGGGNLRGLVDRLFTRREREGGGIERERPTNTERGGGESEREPNKHSGTETERINPQMDRGTRL